jgi:hypothetical protein
MVSWMASRANRKWLGYAAMMSAMTAVGAEFWEAPALAARTSFVVRLEEAQEYIITGT